MLFSHGSPPRNDKQMPNAFMDVIFLLSHPLALLCFFFLSLLSSKTHSHPHPALPFLFHLAHPLLKLFFSVSAGAMLDHGSSDYDPVFTAGRLLCLCLSSNRLLCLHHPGGAFCSQGALTRHWHLWESTAHNKEHTHIALKAKVKLSGLSVKEEGSVGPEWGLKINF